MSMEFEIGVLPLSALLRHTYPTQIENGEQAQSGGMYGIECDSEFPCCCCNSVFPTFHDFCEHLEECEGHRNAE